MMIRNVDIEGVGIEHDAYRVGEVEAPCPSWVAMG